MIHPAVKRLSLLTALCLAFLAAAPVSAESLTFPQGLEEIEEEAFFGDETLTELVIPEGVLRIGPRAFAGTALTRIEFPDSVTEIAADAFDGVEAPQVTAPQGSYAWSWCVARGWIGGAGTVALTHASLSGGRLSLPDGAAAGAVCPITVTAPGDWTLSFQYPAPTTAKWLTADRLSGTGSGQVELKVLQAPAPKDYRVPETYVSRVTLESGGKSASIYVTLSKAGKFINRHLNTGNHAEDVVAIAQSQVGYHGGTGAGDLSGDPAQYVDRNYNKYTIFLGYGATAWCAAFVSWCAWQAGARNIVPGSVTASPGKMMGSNISNCTVYYFNELTSVQQSSHRYLSSVGVFMDRANCYPKRGDFIYFRWSTASASTTFSHVGIVVSCTGGQITYIDGNRGDDEVMIHTIPHDDPDIAAYFTPW